MFLDGNFVGQPPVILESLTLGSYTVTVRGTPPTPSRASRWSYY
jgi:hypothetical protein